MLATCFWTFFVPLILAKPDEKAVYKFQEFFYKGNSKNEIAFREFESACEQSPDCTSKTGIERFACIRRCISPSCHHDLYGHDPLEEGEIDVNARGKKFLQFVQNKLDMLWEEVYLQKRLRMWRLVYGAPPNCDGNVRAYSNFRCNESGGTPDTDNEEASDSRECAPKNENS